MFKWFWTIFSLGAPERWRCFVTVYYYKRDAKERQENEVTYQEAQVQPHESTDK